MNNTWRIIPSLESYAINEDGVIKALPKIREGRLDCLNNHTGTAAKSQRMYGEHIIKQKYTSRYWYVCLMHNGIKKSYRVHRLVYRTFIGEIPNGMFIDHIDGDRNNNNVHNLKCVTRIENAANPNTKYNNCKSVIQLDPKTNKIIGEYRSIEDAVLNIGRVYSNGHIGECCSGKRKTAYGFKWKFK